jgi:hypothetical protein
LIGVWRSKCREYHLWRDFAARSGDRSEEIRQEVQRETERQRERQRERDREGERERERQRERQIVWRDRAETESEKPSPQHFLDLLHTIIYTNKMLLLT